MALFCFSEFALSVKAYGFASSPKGRAKSTAGSFLITPNTLAMSFTAWLSLRGKTSPAPGEDVAQRQKGESGAGAPERVGVPLGELAANAVSRLRGYWSSNTFFCAYTPTSASPVLLCTSSSCPVRLESRAM